MDGRGETTGNALAAVGAAFAIEGAFAGAERLGSGHIHATWLATWETPEGPRRFVHQRLNTRVFGDPAGLMENLLRVTAHLRAHVEAEGHTQPERRVLEVLRAREGAPLHVDPSGGVWRTTRFIEGSRGVAAPADAHQAFAAARAFGELARWLSDLPPPPLRVTIPHFHDMERRQAAFEASLARDARGRAHAAAAEVGALRHLAATVARELPERAVAALPRRIAHHDCKLDNLLLDAGSSEPLCVVDLDTVMEGTLLSDFGELVRTAACRAAEDEPDPEQLRFDPETFEALARGYLAGTGALLAPAETAALPLAGARFALMNAARFLTDHLDGDAYFRIHREGQNLGRARAQLRLAEVLLAEAPRARRIVAGAAG